GTHPHTRCTSVHSSSRPRWSTQRRPSPDGSLRSGACGAFRSLSFDPSSPPAYRTMAAAGCLRHLHQGDLTTAARRCHSACPALPRSLQGRKLPPHGEHRHVIGLLGITRALADALEDVVEKLGSRLCTAKKRVVAAFLVTGGAVATPCLGHAVGKRDQRSAGEAAGAA